MQSAVRFHCRESDLCAPLAGRWPMHCASGCWCAAGAGQGARCRPPAGRRGRRARQPGSSLDAQHGMKTCQITRSSAIERSRRGRGADFDLITGPRTAATATFRCKRNFKTLGGKCLHLAVSLPAQPHCPQTCSRKRCSQSSGCGRAHQCKCAQCSHCRSNVLIQPTRRFVQPHRVRMDSADAPLPSRSTELPAGRCASVPCPAAPPPALRGSAVMPLGMVGQQQLVQRKSMSHEHPPCSIGPT